MPLAAVFFDVGETLVDETESWGAWADWLGVPRLTFFAALGAVLADGGDRLAPAPDRPLLRSVVRLVRPDLDPDSIRRRRGEDPRPLVAARRADHGGRVAADGPRVSQRDQRSARATDQGRGAARGARHGPG